MVLNNFIFKQETKTHRDFFSRTVISKVIRGTRCIMWIRHINYPNINSNLSENLKNFHPELSISYLRQIGTVRQEIGNENSDNFSIIFEFIRN
jgi:hypothetical protein